MSQEAQAAEPQTQEAASAPVEATPVTPEESKQPAAGEELAAADHAQEDKPEENQLTIGGMDERLAGSVKAFDAVEFSSETRTEFLKHFNQQGFKYLVDGLDHIDSAKRAEKRLAEVPALLEAKLKEIDAFSSSSMPQEYHKKENREKVKVLTKDLEALEAEQKQLPEDVKFRLSQADTCIKNFDFTIERIELVKRLK